MKLLVLGGTKFLGRAVVETALERGHEVTLFNRGETNPDLFPETEKLRGDREGELSGLEGRSWDAAVDPSGYVPHVVRASAELLAGSVGCYLFVSSISVYADASRGPSEESSLEPLGDRPLDRLADDYSNYGPLKALCEDAVRDVFREEALVVRPGLIVGPHDPTGRFTYWPHRIARGGQVIAPGPADRRIQFVDVRDLGSWLVDLCERRQAGTFNATHPGLAWGELAETCREVAGSDARFIWVSDEFLVEQGVGEWMELPLWIQDPEWAGTHSTDVSRAVAAGLRFRPLAETVRATLEEAQPTEEAGLATDRERELLEAWGTRT